MPPQIIAVIGAPGTGKSFLAKRLAEKLNAKLFLEGEIGDFPLEILKKLERNICDYAVYRWFRDQLRMQMFAAQKLKAQGKTVILDTYWDVCGCYLDLISDLEEKEKAAALSKEDRSLPLPDQIIFLKASEATIRKLMKQRARYYEDEKILTTNLHLARKHEETFTAEKLGARLIIIDREELDFNQDKDLDLILRKLNK